MAAKGKGTGKRYVAVLHYPDGTVGEVRVSVRDSRTLEAIAAHLGTSAELAAMWCQGGARGVPAQRWTARVMTTQAPVP